MNLRYCISGDEYLPVNELTKYGLKTCSFSIATVNKVLNTSELNKLKSRYKGLPSNMFILYEDLGGVKQIIELWVSNGLAESDNAEKVYPQYMKEVKEKEHLCIILLEISESLFYDLEDLLDYYVGWKDLGHNEIDLEFYLPIPFKRLLTAEALRIHLVTHITGLDNERLCDLYVQEIKEQNKLKAVIPIERTKVYYAIRKILNEL